MCLSPIYNDSHIREIAKVHIQKKNTKNIIMSLLGSLNFKTSVCSISTIFNKIVEKFFSVKKTLLHPNQCCLQNKNLGFWQQSLARFNIDIWGKGEKLEFEKLNHFLDLLAFQLFSKQVLSRVVASPSLKT